MRTVAAPEIEEGDSVFQKRERRRGDVWMSGAGEKEGERARKKGITGGMEERKGGLGIPIKVGARVGGRGIGPDWERHRRSPQRSNSHGKKRGGEERWTG